MNEVLRKMTIACIASTDYLMEVRDIIKPEFVEVHVSRVLIQWSVDYFDRYGKAPGKDIVELYERHASTLPEDIAEELSEDVLPDLSEEWEYYGINLESLITSTRLYFKEAEIRALKEHVERALERNDIEGAEQLLTQYKGIPDVNDVLILNDSRQLKHAIEEVFSEANESILKYPGALGEFWNGSMVRGGFVALLAPEKRGKSALMIDMAIRAVRQKNKVVVFQAGDMTQLQQLRRIAIYLTKKSDKEKYTGVSFIPVKDCFFNQIDDCDKELRECDFGVFSDRKWKDVMQARHEVNYDDLVEAIKENSEYRPCHNCSAYHSNVWAVPYLKKITIKDTLTEFEAFSVLEDYFCKKNRNLRIATYKNNTLSVQEMSNVLHKWKRQENWMPDIIIIDYADLLVGKGHDERTRQNNIWKDLRALNQDTNCLLITATQADAASYDQDTLKLRNFSEDKRKYAHVTAFYGLNQDSNGREKRMGILRLNELLLRDDDFNSNRQVTVLQALHIGRPVLTSYW